MARGPKPDWKGKTIEKLQISWHLGIGQLSSSFIKEVAKKHATEQLVGVFMNCPNACKAAFASTEGRTSVATHLASFFQ